MDGRTFVLCFLAAVAALAVVLTLRIALRKARELIAGERFWGE